MRLWRLGARGLGSEVRASLSHRDDHGVRRLRLGLLVIGLGALRCDSGWAWALDSNRPGRSGSVTVRPVPARDRFP